ncbi:MAG TPA: type II toxin-antitoxin system HicB family antitoxin [Gemmatimonadales bacterium]|jgi:predicted RNase H-like HicB family nuclease
MTETGIDRAILFAAWTFRGGPDLDGSGAYVIEIDELPGFFVAADTEDEAIHELTPALAAHLTTLARLGRDVPRPAHPGWLPEVRRTPTPSNARLEVTPRIPELRLQTA